MINACNIKVFLSSPRQIGGTSVLASTRAESTLVPVPNVLRTNLVVNQRREFFFPWNRFRYAYVYDFSWKADLVRCSFSFCFGCGDLGSERADARHPSADDDSDYPACGEADGRPDRPFADWI